MNTPLQRRGSFGVRSPRRQRGAVAVMTSVFILFIALGCAALVIDTGRLYLEQRSLQRTADAVALDTAQQSGLCGSGDVDDATVLAQAAAVRNGFEGEFGGSGNEVLLGRLEDAGGRWQFFPDEDDAEAVHVQVSRTVPASLILGGLFGQEVTLSKQATARRIPRATIGVGSGLLSVDSTESPLLDALLGGLLGSDVSLDAVSYEGLAAARISLADLLEADSTAGSINELLNSDVTLLGALELFAEAASQANAASADLNGLLGASGEIRDVTLRLADILNVASPTPASGLQADIGLLDLISATALLANQHNAVTVPLGIGLEVGGLTNVAAELDLFVVEPPQFAIGPPGRDQNGNWRTEAHTAQVRANLDVQTSLDLLGLVNADVLLGVALQSASGAAWLKSIHCSTYARQAFDPTVIGAQTGLASLSLGRFVDPASNDSTVDNSQINLSLLGGQAVSVTAELSVAEGNDRVELGASAVNDLEYSGRRADLSQSKNISNENPAAALSQGLADLAANMEVEVEAEVIGWDPLGLLAALVNTLLNGLSDALLNQLLQPLLTGLDALLVPILNALGISVATADVMLVDVEMGPVELVR